MYRFSLCLQSEITRVAKVSLAGIHDPDTTCFFGDLGIIEVTDQLTMRAWLSRTSNMIFYDQGCDLVQGMDIHAPPSY